MNFEPDFTQPLSKRFDLFKDELVFLADTKYRLYLDARKDDIDMKVYQHRIWYYIEPDIEKTFKSLIAVFGITKGRNLPIKMREDFFRVFYKHFPQDGKATSGILDDLPLNP